MTIALIPTIGYRGSYLFDAPFEVYNNVLFRCATHRQYHSFLLDGIDIVTDIYNANAIDDSRRSSDEQANITICGMETSTNEIILIPASFFRSAGIQDGVPYTERALVVSLGILPTDYNTTTLRQVLDVVIKSMVGNVPNYKEAALSYATFFDTEAAALLEYNRALLRNSNDSDTVRLHECQTRTLTLQAKLAEAERFILGGLEAFDSGEPCKTMDTAFSANTYLDIDVDAPDPSEDVISSNDPGSAFIDT